MKTSNTPAANTAKKPILVIGGNGKTGSRVVRKLEQLQWPVRIGSRSSQPAFDWKDENTWSAALKGMDQVYITYQPDLAVPGATESIEKLTKLAKETGVRKLVLLSGRGEHEAQECEKIVMDAGLEWSIVRASWFFQNFSEGAFLEQVQAGHVALPANSVGEPFIDVDDIAEVAVATMTQDGHNGKLYEVTGPRLLTFKDAVAEIAKATGKPIEFQQVTMDEYASVMAEYNLPGDIVWLITYLFTEVLDGRNEYIATGVEEALGRKPHDFSEYAKNTAATGIWN